MEKKRKAKNKGGRPSKKDQVNWKAAAKMYNLGATDKEVCEAFDITEVTLHAWKKQPEFSKSLNIKDWKDVADGKVEASLFQSACGFEYDEVTYEAISINGEMVPMEKMQKVKLVKKKHAPNSTAQIFWLKNRKPEVWRDKQDVQQSGEIIIRYDDGSNTAKGNPLR